MARRPAVRRRLSTGSSWDDWSDRKKTTVVAVVFFGALGVLLGAVLIAAAVSYHPSAEQRAADHNEAIADPQSISGPDYGQAPAHPGDPGGWEQLALGGLLTVVLAGGGLLLIRSSHRARRRNAAATGDPVTS